MLAHHGIAFSSRDIFKSPLSGEEIRGLLRRVSLDELLSWRSPSARARGLRSGSLGEEDAVQRMAEEPRLIRRPIIVAEDRLIIGFDKDAIAALA